MRPSTASKPAQGSRNPRIERFNALLHIRNLRNLSPRKTTTEDTLSSLTQRRHKDDGVSSPVRAYGTYELRDSIRYCTYEIHETSHHAKSQPKTPRHPSRDAATRMTEYHPPSLSAIKFASTERRAWRMTGCLRWWFGGVGAFVYFVCAVTD